MIDKTQAMDRLIAQDADLIDLPTQSDVWQPIETAPTDGTDILLLANGMAIEARHSPGEWSEDTPASPAEYSGAVWVAFDGAVQFEIEEGEGPDRSDHHGDVTHWMPLPPPPALQEQSK
jgi:hypothetical protein